MNMKLWSVILLPAVLATGCVRTVSDRDAAAVPFVKDKVEARYERSVDQVYDAALYVVQFNGTIQNEVILHQADATARAIEGRVDQRRVWIRVEPVDAKVTSVVVQARTSAGGTDMNLAHELDKQIALRLASQ